MCIVYNRENLSMNDILLIIKGAKNLSKAQRGPFKSIIVPFDRLFDFTLLWLHSIAFIS